MMRAVAVPGRSGGMPPAIAAREVVAWDWKRGRPRKIAGLNRSGRRRSRRSSASGTTRSTCAMPEFSAELLAKWTGGRWTALPTAPLRGFMIDSRQLRAGQVFVAIKTGKRDGHDFLMAA